MTHYDKFEDIPLFYYDIIKADPAWLFKLRSEKGEKKSAQNQYRCMTIEDIRALRVGDLAASTGCVLWMYCTNPMLPEGLSTLDSWGFRYVSAGSWFKRFPDKVNPKCGCVKKGGAKWGTGYVLRSTNEPFLIGKIGSIKTANNIPSGFEGVAREHSRKPEEGYALAEKMIVSDWPVRRLDLFSRQERPGWDSFGDEGDLFNG